MIIGKEILYLSKKDVKDTGLTMKTCVDLMEDAFLRRAHGTIAMPHKLTVIPDSHLLLLGMGCSISPDGGTGIKWLSGCGTNGYAAAPTAKRPGCPAPTLQPTDMPGATDPDHIPAAHMPGTTDPDRIPAAHMPGTTDPDRIPAAALPRYTGIIILNDFETGVPICMMDAEFVTSMRTAAVSGLGLRFLANKDARAVGVFGCGEEGRSNLLAAVTECPLLDTVLIRSRDPERSHKYIEDMKKLLSPLISVGHPEIHFEISEDAETIVRRSDILLCSCPSTHGDEYRTIRPEWLKNGVTAVPVCQDSLFKDEAMPAFDLLFTDDRESYDIRKAQGHFKNVPDTPPELGDLITDLKAAGSGENNFDCKIRRLTGRTSHDQKALLITAGLAMEDIAVANWVYKKALEQGIGTILPR